MKNYQKISIAAISLCALIAFTVVIVNNYKTKTSFKHGNKEMRTISADEAKKIAQDKVAEAVNKNAQAKNEEAKAPKQEPQKTPNDPSNDILKISSTDLVYGDQDAPVTMIEYSSLSCPHCAAFHHEAFAKVKKEYIDTKKVKFIHRDFPLNQPALAASMFAICKADSDVTKYYYLLKALFNTQDAWAFDPTFIEKLRSIAKLDGMDAKDFNSCINNDDLQNRILKGRIDAANALKIQSTPTFFINGARLEGYVDYVTIQKAIDTQLTKTK